MHWMQMTIGRNKQPESKRVLREKAMGRRQQRLLDQLVKNSLALWLLICAPMVICIQCIEVIS